MNLSALFNPKDLFAPPKRRFKRAETHIRKIEELANGFSKAQTYAVVVEPDFTGPFHPGVAHKIKLSGEIPEEITDLTVEAAEHLRSVLDGAGYASAIAWGQKGGPDERVLPHS